MQTQKMSLANIQGKLSRTEMKNIMAGGDKTVGRETGCYRCYWTGTTSCSGCTYSYSTASCTSGATLTSQGCPSQC